MRVEMTVFANLSDQHLENFLCSIFSSLIAILCWSSPTLYSINLVLAAYMFGFGLHQQLICRRFHSKEALTQMHEEAWRNSLALIDAERIKEGLKPISDWKADE